MSRATVGVSVTGSPRHGSGVEYTQFRRRPVKKFSKGLRQSWVYSTRLAYLDELATLSVTKARLTTRRSLQRFPRRSAAVVARQTCLMREPCSPSDAAMAGLPGSRSPHCRLSERLALLLVPSSSLVASGPARPTLLTSLPICLPFFLLRTSMHCHTFMISAKTTIQAHNLITKNLFTVERKTAIVNSITIMSSKCLKS